MVLEEYVLKKERKTERVYAQHLVIVPNLIDSQLNVFVIRSSIDRSDITCIQLSDGCCVHGSLENKEL